MLTAAKTAVLQTEKFRIYSTTHLSIAITGQKGSFSDSLTHSGLVSQGFTASSRVNKRGSFSPEIDSWDKKMTDSLPQINAEALQTLEHQTHWPQPLWGTIQMWCFWPCLAVKNRFVLTSTMNWLTSVDSNLQSTDRNFPNCSFISQSSVRNQEKKKGRLLESIYAWKKGKS